MVRGTIIYSSCMKIGWNPLKLVGFCFVFLVLRDWTQALTLARQVLYHLNHAQNSFCFSDFGDRVLDFCLGPTWTVILLFMLFA
jgi:hypothetical protein